MSAVSVNTYSYTAAHLAGNLIRSVTDIVKGCGLDPGTLTQVAVLDAGLRKWIETRHLEALVLEVFNSRTGNLVGRFDFDIDYGYSTSNDGSFWLDTEQVKIAIRKAALTPVNCDYRVLVTTNPGAPHVAGWVSTSFRSTEGFSRYAVGTAIGAGSTAAGVSYYSRS